MNEMRALGGQIARFSLVGLSNTAVDFVAANILYFTLAPDSDAALFLMSIAACLLATANSYIWNSRWTFADADNRKHTTRRFVLTAGMGMLINTAIFLFLMRHLPLSGLSNEFVVLNLARVGGVAGALLITFCGYRLWAFAPRLNLSERGAGEKPVTDSGFPAGQILMVSLLALVARLVFLWIAPVIYGDAVNYAWVARLTASGDLAAVDLFWHSLFDFWQALFVWLGAGLYAAPVLASLIPGLMLVWPIALITYRLFGKNAALLAAAMVAVHPRLVEYSLNGYAESFYLLGAVWATWGLLVLATNPRRLDAVLAAGLGFSAWLLVRNEALLYAAIALLLAFAFKRQQWREVTGAAVRVAAIVGVFITAYALTNIALWGQPGLSQKSSNLARQHTEMLDMREAARETYSTTEPESRKPGMAAVVTTLAKRWPQNVRYMAERLPGILLSPIFLFALLLPILTRRRSGRGAPVWPVVLMLLWPIAFYPLIQLEPRMLFPTLIGVIILGSQGALLAGQRLSKVIHWRPTMIRWAPGVATVLLLLPLIPVLAWHSGSERGFHREVGNWLADALPPDVELVGDGYGYVSASAFWAERRAEPRLWTDEANVLAESVKDDAVLLIYERYLREANPELLSVMDDGLPGMVRIAEFDFPRIGRVQAWGHSHAGFELR